MINYVLSRNKNDEDEVWFLEHRPIYTLGLGATEENILDSGDIPVMRSDFTVVKTIPPVLVPPYWVRTDVQAILRANVLEYSTSTVRVRTQYWIKSTLNYYCKFYK